MIDRGGPVIVVGVGGGLVEGAAPGSVVVASELIAGDAAAEQPERAGDDPRVLHQRAGRAGASRYARTVPIAAAAEIATALSATGRRVDVGPIISTDHIVRGEERAELASRGALAVDMESYWLAELAPAHASPFGVVRVLLDVPGTELMSPRGAGAVRAAFSSLQRCASALQAWADELERSRPSPQTEVTY